MKEKTDPERPANVDKMMEEAENVRNFYWNQRMERSIIPEWRVRVELN